MFRSLFHWAHFTCPNFFELVTPSYFLRNLIVERESAPNTFSATPSFGPDFSTGNLVSDESEVPVVQSVRSKFFDRVCHLGEPKSRRIFSHNRAQGQL